MTVGAVAGPAAACRGLVGGVVCGGGGCGTGLSPVGGGAVRPDWVAPRMWRLHFVTGVP